MLENVFLLVIGLIGGFLGAQVGGGALVMLPALLYLGLEPVLAIGAIVFSGVFLNFGAAWGYWKSHRPDLKIILPIGLIGAVGSVLGAYVVNNIDSELLSKILGALLLVPIVLLILKRGSSENATSQTKQTLVLVGTLLAFVAGVYGGMLAISATTLFLLLFVFFFGRSMVQGAADAVTATIIFALATFAVFAWYGNIPYLLSLPLAAGALIGSLVGARVAVNFGERWIKALLIIIALATALSLFFK